MKKSLTTVLVLAAIVLVVIILIANSTFKIIEPGQRGLIFRKFTTGLDKENIYAAGLEVIAPWNQMIIYDVREQTIEFESSTQFGTLDVLDKNGLSIHADVTVRFHPIYGKIGDLYEEFGKNDEIDLYIARLIIPEVRSSVRKVMGRYSAEEIYSTKRKEVEDSIIHETAKTLEYNNVQMTALLIRSIILPDQLKKSIEEKQKREQDALAMKCVNDKELLEAERKRIAAEGEARANQIINSSLTDELLKMRGIEATIELSKSANTKVVVIGSGKDGLPLILGDK